MPDAKRSVISKSEIWDENQVERRCDLSCAFRSKKESESILRVSLERVARGKKEQRATLFLFFNMKIYEKR